METRQWKEIYTKPRHDKRQNKKSIAPRITLRTPSKDWAPPPVLQIAQR